MTRRACRHACNGIIIGPLLLLLTSLPARGGIAAGTCLVDGTVTFRFDADITMDLQESVWIPNVSGGGTCVASSSPMAPLETFTLSGTDGDASSAACYHIRADGEYGSLTFSGTSPNPPASNGQWSFVGSSAGGLLLLTSMNPTTVFPMVLIAEDDAQVDDCPDVHNPTIFTYTALVPVFADP